MNQQKDTENPAFCSFQARKGATYVLSIASDRDVLAFEVEDHRTSPPPLEVSVATQRPAERIVGKHLTRCTAGGDGASVHVTQLF